MPSSVPELREQIRRRLRPDAGDAGHVVARVARQREEVAHAGSARTPNFSRTSRGPVDAVAHRVPHDDAIVVVVDELHQVLVGADDDDAQPLARARAPSTAAMRSSASSPSFWKTGDVPGADDLLDPRHLLRQVGRRRRARRLVARVERVAEASGPCESIATASMCGRRSPTTFCSMFTVPEDGVRRLALASSRGAAARGRRGRRSPRGRRGRATSAAARAPAGGAWTHPVPGGCPPRPLSSRAMRDALLAAAGSLV